MKSMEILRLSLTLNEKQNMNTSLVLLALNQKFAFPSKRNLERKFYQVIV